MSQGRVSREEKWREEGDGQHLAVPEVKAQGEIEAQSRLLLGDEWGGVRGKAAFILLENGPLLMLSLTRDLMTHVYMHKPLCMRVHIHTGLHHLTFYGGPHRSDCSD